MNGKTLTLAAIAASLLVGTASGAFAEDRGDRRGHGRGGPEVRFVQMLQKFDTDKDGKITKDEAKAAGETLFVSIDLDKDGSLTPGELRQHHEKMRDEMKAARQEAKANAQPGSPEDDADAAPGGPDAKGPDGKGPDGAGPKDGMGPRDGKHGGRHHGDRHEGKRHGWDGDRADRGERGEGRGHHGGMGGGKGMMMRIADTDENGQISKAEAATMSDKMFERMDTNKDGVINADDMPKRPMFFR